MARSIYQPPRQSAAGQIFDAVIILAAVFLALYIPLKLGWAGADTKEILPAGVTHTITQDAEGNNVHAWTGLTWDNLGQNATMQAQWEKLGYSIEDAAGLITVWFDYSFSWAGFIVTALVVLAYFVFLIGYSDKEYREVIAEKFDGR